MRMRVSSAIVLDNSKWPSRNDDNVGRDLERHSGSADGGPERLDHFRSHECTSLLGVAIPSCSEW